MSRENRINIHLIDIFNSNWFRLSNDQNRWFVFICLHVFVGAIIKMQMKIIDFIIICDNRSMCKRRMKRAQREKAANVDLDTSANI